MSEQMLNRWVDGGRDSSMWSRNLTSFSSWSPNKTTFPSFLCNLVESHDWVLANGMCVGSETWCDGKAQRWYWAAIWVNWRGNLVEIEWGRALCSYRFRPALGESPPMEFSKQGCHCGCANYVLYKGPGWWSKWRLNSSPCSTPLAVCPGTRLHQPAVRLLMSLPKVTSPC